MKTQSFALTYVSNLSFGSDTIVTRRDAHKGIAWADNMGPADKIRISPQS
jgi:hypothetical protein